METIKSFARPKRMTRYTGLCSSLDIVQHVVIGARWSNERAKRGTTPPSPTSCATCARRRTRTESALVVVGEHKTHLPTVGKSKIKQSPFRTETERPIRPPKDFLYGDAIDCQDFVPCA